MLEEAVVVLDETPFKESERGPEELSVVGFKPLLIKEIITAAAVSVYEMIGVFFLLVHLAHKERLL